MDIIKSVKGWVGHLADLGVSLLALTIVAELLGLGCGTIYARRRKCNRKCYQE